MGDVEGDGDLDAIATTHEPTPRVVVLRNDGGTLTSDAALLLTILDEPDFQIVDLDPWHPDASGAQRWLVAGEDGVALAVIDLEAGGLRFLERLELSAEASATADLDGDGLLDLVLATEDEMLLYYAQDVVGPRGSP
ncbi:MAG: hypothetical protein H6712_20565 [Myxococcales bacterium]|nr:hypothetical protein [Myxococcales bacterium]